MLEEKYLELLQFNKIKLSVINYCFSVEAKDIAMQMVPKSSLDLVLLELKQTQEMLQMIEANGFVPSVEFESIIEELNYLQIEGSALQTIQLLKVSKTVEGCNSLIRFMQRNADNFPNLYLLSNGLVINTFLLEAINRVIDVNAEVKSSASIELSQIRKNIQEKRRDSDKQFYALVAALRKQGYLRENEESFYNGRRTLAIMSENKSDVFGMIHGKSESGKTIFIEPMVTVALNNEIAELEIDERREINRILRELCASIKIFVPEIKKAQVFLQSFDFIKAKALLARDLNACLPEINRNFELNIIDAYHPLLYLQNKKSEKKTIPLSVKLNAKQRILVISGPNAGGKTVALKTIGILQMMLQSGLLIPVKPLSNFSFFEDILIDIGDTQSIENELSTYSAKLISMTNILEQANESTLILMDEFGSGTDPELGSAIAESVLENLVVSKAKAIITTHFGKVKLLAENLEGCLNASMLFDIENLKPYYKLNIGKPGSSFTFEVAEKIGFPLNLIQRAKTKINKDELKLSQLISELQDQKLKQEIQEEKLEHEIFLMKISKEKYNTLFHNWEEKINKERERKIELSNMADYGQKYLRLMEDWNTKKDRKLVIQRFIDGITAETKKQEQLNKQNLKSNYSAKKIERIKPQIKIGTKVRVLNGKEVGIVESIKEEKVLVQIGLMKLTVGMENIVIVE